MSRHAVDKPRGVDGSSARPPTEGAFRRRWARADITNFAASVLVFALVAYLALRGGGFDPVVHAEVGAVGWLTVIAVTIAGVAAPVLSRRSWLALGFLAAFVAWTAISLSWTESVERSVEELVRVATYLVVFGLTLGAAKRGAAPRMLAAMGGAIAFVSILALLSRFHPSWFPENQLALTQPGTAERLNYPLNYWNGVAAFVAMGVPILLSGAVTAKRTLSRVASAASLPVIFLTIFLTYSRAGLLLAVLGAVVTVWTHPRRVNIFAIAIATALGSALLIHLTNQRAALSDGLANELAHQQGTEMAAVSCLVCALVGSCALLASRIRLPARPLIRMGPGRRPKLMVGAAIVGVLALAVGAPERLSDRWEDFKRSEATPSGSERLQAATGNGRYQYWGVALDTFADQPLTGTGAGTFRYVWARNASLPGPVKDAHSLYFETLAEVGLPGLVCILLVAFSVIAAAIVGLKQSIQRASIAASVLGTSVVFSLGAGLDWFWELPAITIVFLIAAACVLGLEATDDTPSSRGKQWKVRTGCILAAVSMLVVFTSVIVGQVALRSSQSAAAAGDLSAALSSARDARTAQPYSASAQIQHALVLLAQGNKDDAADAAQRATEKEPTNWQTWTILAQIEQARAHTVEAERALETAERLNPQSPLFVAPPPTAETQ